MAIPQELIQSFAHAPDGAFLPWATYTAAVAATLGITYRDVAEFQKTAEQDAALGASEGALRASMEGSKFRPLLHRLGPTAVKLAGITLMAASLVSHPTYESHSADAVVVLDSSLPMANTIDMAGHINRLESAIEALEQDGPGHNVGVVQFGSGAIPSLSLGSHSAGDFKELISDSINRNGEAISAAISDAEAMLPSAGLNKSGAAARSGEIIIVSDGVSIPQTDLPDLQKDGIEVKVIVPGNAKATDYINGSGPFQSGADPANFSEVYGTANVTIAGSSNNAVKTAIANAINANNSGEQNKTWYPPYVAAGALIVGSYLWDRKQRVGKVI